MENCCYGSNEMMVLNMVRAGLFGELVHGEAAYIPRLPRNPLLERVNRVATRHTGRNEFTQVVLIRLGVEQAAAQKGDELAELTIR